MDESLVEWPGQSRADAQFVAASIPPWFYSIDIAPGCVFGTDEWIMKCALWARHGDWIARQIVAYFCEPGEVELPEPILDVDQSLMLPMALYAWRGGYRELAQQIWARSHDIRAQILLLSVAHLNDDDHSALVDDLHSLPQNDPHVMVELAVRLCDGATLESLGEFRLAAQAYAQTCSKTDQVRTMYLRAIEQGDMPEFAAASLKCFDLRLCDNGKMLQHLASMCTEGKVLLGVHLFDRRLYDEGVSKLKEAGVIAGGPKLVELGVWTEEEYVYFKNEFMNSVKITMML